MSGRVKGRRFRVAHGLEPKPCKNSVQTLAVYAALHANTNQLLSMAPDCIRQDRIELGMQHVVSKNEHPANEEDRKSVV